jgi:hypothetical protein
MQAHVTNRMPLAHGLFSRRDERTSRAHRVRSSRQIVWKETLAFFTVLAVVTIVLSAATGFVTIMLCLVCRLVGPT